MSTAEPPERPTWARMSETDLLGALIARGEAHEEARLLVDQWQAGNELAAVEITRVLEESDGG